MWQNKYPPKIFAILSSRLEFQSEILSTYIYSSYAHIMYFKVVRITVTSPSDFSSKTFIEKCIPEYRVQNRMWISCLDFIAKMTKYAGKFHFEIPSDWWENCKKNLRGILFAAPVCYTNSSLALAGIYTYISLRFTQSNSPTHTKSLFSFRNTCISRISR